MTVNEPLVRQIIEYIENYPDEWSQQSYGFRTDCNTTHCIAGWALHFSGVELDWKFFQYDSSYIPIKTKSGEDIAEAAQRVLGLTEEQSDIIFFNYTKSLSEMKNLITETTGIEFK